MFVFSRTKHTYSSHHFTCVPLISIVLEKMLKISPFKMASLISTSSFHMSFTIFLLDSFVRGKRTVKKSSFLIGKMLENPKLLRQIFIFRCSTDFIFTSLFFYLRRWFSYCNCGLTKTRSHSRLAYCSHHLWISIHDSSYT
jgi:hypothetical protein